MSEDVAVTTVPVDTPPLEVSPSVLEKLEPREYNAIRDAQEHEAKHPEPDEPAEADETSETGNVRPPRKSGFEKRIAKLTRRAYENESRAIAAEKRAAELQARLTSGSSAPEQGSAVRTEAPRSEPIRNRPRDYDETLEAANNVKVSPQFVQAFSRTENKRDIVYYLQKNPEVLKAIEREPAKAAERIAKLSHDLAGYHDSLSREAERQQQLRATHGQKFNSLLMAAPDRDKINETLKVAIPIHKAVEDAVFELDNSAETSLHILRNRGLIDELNRMNPLAAVAKVGRIAEQLAARAQAPPREKVRPPEPISMVGGTSALSSIPLDQSDMKTFMKVRNAQEQRRRNG